MKVKRAVFLFLLLCAEAVFAQKTEENLFIGTWSDGQSTLKVECLGTDFVCIFVNEEGDTIDTKNVAIAGGKMFIDFIIEIDTFQIYNGTTFYDTLIDHWIFTCKPTRRNLIITQHSIVEYNGTDFAEPKSRAYIYKKVEDAEKKSDEGNMKSFQEENINTISEDSIRAYVASLLKSIHTSGTDNDFHYFESHNRNYSDLMSNFVKYNKVLSLMVSRNSPLKTDSVMMRRYTECLFARAIIYKFLLADTITYVNELKKINDIKQYQEVSKDLITVETERRISSAKSLSDTVRFYEKAVNKYLKGVKGREKLYNNYSYYYGNNNPKGWKLDEQAMKNTLAYNVLIPKIVWLNEYPVGFSFDTIYDFFLKNPHTLYLGNTNCAIFTMNELVKKNRYLKALEFYENIKPNFSFNDSLNSLYVKSLLEEGYTDEAMCELIRRSRSTAPLDILHLMVQAEMVGNQMLYGQLWGDTEEIEDNVEAFAFYYKVPASTIYAYLATSYYYKKNYRKASENVQAFFQLEQDSSQIMLLQANIFANMAKKEQSTKQRDIQIQNAKQCYQAIVDYENRHGIYSNKSLAYIGLKKERLAVEEFEKEFEIKGDSLSSSDYLLAAQIYAQVGDTSKAISSITIFLDMDHGSVIREFILNEPYLEPIGDTIKKLCEKYKKLDTLSNYDIYRQNIKRVFDTITTSVSFSPSRNGTIFLKECRIGNIELNGLIFDPGAEISQISRALVDKLLKQGTIRPEDCLGPLTTEVADGKKQVNGMVYRIPSFEIGTINLKNVHAFVPDNPPNVPLLLGENAFGDMIVTINPRKLTISFTKIVEKRKNRHMEKK